jgi:hypothetical protein
LLAVLTEDCSQNQGKEGGAKNREPFERLNVLFLVREGLLALRIFPVKNLEVFQKYSEFHAVNTRLL